MQSLLTVTTSAESYDLTVLETVKLELGIEVGDGSQDVKLTAWIHQASDAIASTCKRVFAKEIVSEVFRNTDYCRSSRTLVLSRRPIISITSIVEDSITLLTTEYEVDYKAGIIYRLYSTDLVSRSYWNTSNRIIISYTAGYTLLNDLPYDVERACILLVKYFKMQDGSRGGDFNLKMIEIPGVIRREWAINANINTNNPYNLPPDVMALIGSYIEKVIR